MRQLSKQQELLRELFFLYMIAFENDLDSEITHQKKKNSETTVVRSLLQRLSQHI
jgi:hypothetical protein